MTIRRQYAVAVLAATFAGVAFSGTSFNLGAAGSYGIVMGSDDGNTNSNFSTNNGTINATVGIESGGYFKATGPGTIAGVAFQDAVSDSTYTDGHAITSSQTLSGSNNSLSNTAVTNGLTQNITALGSAATSIANLESLADASISSGTTENLNIGNGSILLSAGASGTTVFNASSVNIGNGGTITINGTANSLVIINVTGNFNAQNGVAGDGVVLTGGITASQVLWNIDSTGNNFTSSGNYTTNIIQGIFLDVAGSYNLNEITVDGWLYGANSDGVLRSGLSDQLVSNFTMNQGAYTAAATPEPSTWAMMCGACVLMFIGARRRKPITDQRDK